MAHLVLRDASVVINGVDLSDHVASVAIPVSRADVQDTAMGAEGVSRLAGLRDEQIQLTFRQDFAASEVDATLWPIYTAGTGVTAVVKPTSAAVGAGNPTFTATVLLLEYAPLDGEVGSIADATATLTVDGVITRAIA